MRESPRYRRLQSDIKALELLASESTIFHFEPFGSPPDFYVLRFAGRGFWKKNPQDEPIVRGDHEIHIRLGASYPRMMPELAWKSPVFHPNISASGVVCLGGYGTYWVPSLALDELCGMLWDMVRYENYDETSPYNREAAAWAKNQTGFRLPIDERPLRDKLVGSPAVTNQSAAAKLFAPMMKGTESQRGSPRRPTSVASPTRFARPSVVVPSPAPPVAHSEVLYIGEAEVIEAEIARPSAAREVLVIE